MSYPLNSSNTGRKRSRYDMVTSTQSTPYTKISHGWSTSFSPNTISPAPLANSRYHLAGGLDTPTASEHVVFQKYGESTTSIHELDSRRGRPYSHTFSTKFGDSDELPPALAHESNGRPRANTNPIPSYGWRKSVFNKLTGAAGKVLEFCWLGVPFRGFFAGGGQGYMMESQRFQVRATQSPAGSIWEDYEGSATPMPGDFPRLSYVENYVETPDLYENSERVSKKTKHSHSNGGSLSNSWIVVTENPTSPSKRKIPFQSIASPASTRRSAPRAASRRQSTASATGPTGRPASAAGLRSPNVHRRTNSKDRPMTPKSARQSTQIQSESPIAIEAAKHIKEMKRRERQEDKEMMDFNKRLQDLIREGKEALGSKVEIEMDGSDEDLW